MMDLSILVPARNEMFLRRTVEDLLAHSEGNTEIIVVLDGWFTELPQHERVTVIYHPVSVGQRAACNEAATLARGTYVMKVDAHCSFDQGFDRKMLEAFKETGDDVTMVPLMKNLHAFDWVCPEGHRRYQGPSGPCKECGKDTVMDVVWRAKDSPKSTSYCFDSEPHFQYFKEFEKRPEGQGEITETMSLQGSCFMLTRERYFALNVCDEAFGSWGSQGIEVAVKTWLSGGRVLCNKRTWYAHLFRTQGGDFGFPYPQSGTQVANAKKRARELFYDNRWPLQKYPLSWLLDRFAPVPGWSAEDLAKLKAWPLQKVGVVYYTDNELDPRILEACQNQLRKAFSGEIVSVSLRPLDFGNNITVPLRRGVLTMFKQILAGLEASTADIVFFCEHDILYPNGYFDFRPPDRTKVYYNTNVWHLRTSDGHCVTYEARRLSQLCGYRDVLLEHYRKRVARVEAEGYSMKIGFEPGSHHRRERIDDLQSDVWFSTIPAVDIKHGGNLTRARWHPSEFRDPRNCRNWREADSVPGWSSLPL